MTLGLFLWMILFLVLNSDMGHFIIYGVVLIIGVIGCIIIGKKEGKKMENHSKKWKRNKRKRAITISSIRPSFVW